MNYDIITGVLVTLFLILLNLLIIILGSLTKVQVYFAKL